MNKFNGSFKKTQVPTPRVEDQKEEVINKKEPKIHENQHRDKDNLERGQKHKGKK